MDKTKFVDILSSQLYGFSIDTVEDCVYVAEILYNAGYRKIPENAVVLTREEYDRLKRVEAERDRIYEIKLDLENQLIEKGFTEYVGADEIERATRKETAEKYHAEINKAIESVPNATKEFIEAWKSKNDEIRKEITEGK